MPITQIERGNNHALFEDNLEDGTKVQYEFNRSGDKQNGWEWKGRAKVTRTTHSQEHTNTQLEAIFPALRREAKEM